MIPDKIKKFIESFAELPGIGPRQATRIAFYLLNQGKNFIENLNESLENLKSIKTCKECFISYEKSKNSENLCHICEKPNRNSKIVAIVEKETDVMSLEKTKKFEGKYLVLGEIPKDGILHGEQKLRLNALKSRIQKSFGKIDEIILAINPGTLGDIESSMLMNELKSFTEKISRLGRGLPTGGEIEFADDETLLGALENRR